MLPAWHSVTVVGHINEIVLRQLQLIQIRLQFIALALSLISLRLTPTFQLLHLPMHMHFMVYESIEICN